MELKASWKFPETELKDVCVFVFLYVSVKDLDMFADAALCDWSH